MISPLSKVVKETNNGKISFLNKSFIAMYYDVISIFLCKDEPHKLLESSLAHALILQRKGR